MKIPLDLLPGDKLWYSKTKFAVVYEDAWHDVYFDRDGVTYITADDGNPEIFYNYSVETGTERDKDSPPVIRVERVNSHGEDVIAAVSKPTWTALIPCESRADARAFAKEWGGKVIRNA